MPNEFEHNLQIYKDKLNDLEQRMQGEYDRAVMALSGGALGLSLAFLRDFAKTDALKASGFLLTAWVAWGVSVVCILFSFPCSVAAMRKAVKQVNEKTIYIDPPGGVWDGLTLALNWAAGILFLVGVVSIAFFMHWNMP